jgi:HupE / UreJ protein
MMKRLLTFIVAAGLSLSAFAHKASDAYLQLKASDTGLNLRLDVALRDLDVALDLDTNGDGRLTWGEIKSASPGIEAYALARLQVAGCPLRSVGQSLERRSDGAYAVLSLMSNCQLAAEPAIRYSLMREVDTTHRGIAKIELAGQVPIVRVLDPTRAAVIEDALVEAQAPAAAAQPVDVPAAVVTPPAMQAATAPVPSAEPQAAPAVGSFIREGIHHILGGYDHVLFLLCLLLPSVMRRTPNGGWQAVPRLRDAVLPLLGIVTAFTLAHSITLALASLKLVSISPAIIEPAIAVTIVLAAIDNVRPIFHGRRGVVTFLFGLIHGFGFASVLGELNLDASQFAWALLQFNLGLELGQLMIVVSATGLLFLARHQRAYPTWVIRGGSAAAMVVATLWFIERTANLSLLPA